MCDARPRCAGLPDRPRRLGLTWLSDQGVWVWHDYKTYTPGSRMAQLPWDLTKLGSGLVAKPKHFGFGMVVVVVIGIVVVVVVIIIIIIIILFCCCCCYSLLLLLLLLL